MELPFGLSFAASKQYFELLTLPDGSFILYAGIGGVLVWVVYSSKRLGMSILVHALYNGFAFLVNFTMMFIFNP
ncbi:MAG: hypothetical protein Q4A26_02420, partial [Candidatus Saccharibacteria bacterium]|nr:hypothetical protein [Candidatus Saccharibacteria bacterium]